MATRTLSRVMVTGGAGFIGSNFIRYLFKKTEFQGRVINVDKLTYAGNPENLSDVEEEFGSRYQLMVADICDHARMRHLFREHDIDTVVHFAAESHVDRSIYGPGEFIQTNIVGTFTLLEAAREAWKGRDDVLFHHVSTDEVYGSLEGEGSFREDTPYSPRSPYSASKASSDHLVRAYHHTYGLPVTISNCSNNYGPYQFPEKLIPLIILNMKDGKPLPVYGDGRNVRDWLHVKDHAAAVWAILNRGRVGETYNVGGNNEWENIAIIHLLCDLMARYTGKDAQEYRRLITFVADRPGHDRRYAIDASKIERELGWRCGIPFQEGLWDTLCWYMEHKDWVERVRSGEYRSWIEKNYGGR